MLSRSPRLPLVAVAALALAAALAASPAAASPWRAGVAPLADAQRSAGADLAAGLRHLLSAIWPDAGCLGDPNGGSHCGISPLRRPAAGRLHPNEGCGGDPNGGSHCGTSPVRRPAAGRLRPNAGCGGDPNGVSHCGDTRRLRTPRT